MPYLSLLTTEQKMDGRFIRGKIFLVQGIFNDTGTRNYRPYKQVDEVC
jgi:hypothetical protein